MPIRHLLPLALTFLLFPWDTSAQSGEGTARLRLAAPTAMPDEPFSGVTDVVELSRERLLVADEKENRLALLDLASGSTRVLGRVGAGPGEYRAIGVLLARPEGGAYLSDFVQRRLLPIRDDGTFENPIPFPGSILLRGIDAAGVLYGEMFFPRDRIQRSDSMFIVRWNPAATAIDTLMQYDAGVTKWVIPVGAARPVNPPVDTWLALASGDILVLEAGAYRAAIFRGGRLVGSVVNPWRPVRVTQAERDAFLRAADASPRRTIGQPGGTPSAAPPRAAFQFPEAYPPFGGAGLGGRYAIRSPRGHVWVERLRATRDSIPHYDVLDASTGALLGAVTLDPRSAVVGFGANAVYTILRDADDIQRVRRHPYPTLTRR